MKASWETVKHSKWMKTWLVKPKAHPCLLFTIGVNPAAVPDYLHEIITDNESGYCTSENSAQGNVERALSGVKVCKQEAITVQNRLRNEYFSEWDETCEIIEARKLSISKLQELVSKLEEQYRGHCRLSQDFFRGTHKFSHSPAPRWSESPISINYPFAL